MIRKFLRGFGILSAGLMIMFGGFGLAGSIGSTQTEIVSADTEVTRGCSAWETYRTTTQCISGNQTLITITERRYCPDKGYFEYRTRTRTVNGCKTQ